MSTFIDEVNKRLAKVIELARKTSLTVRLLLLDKLFTEVSARKRSTRTRERSLSATLEIFTLKFPSLTGENTDPSRKAAAVDGSNGEI